MGVLSRAINRQFRDKPEIPVELNLDHPLSKGLVLDWIGGAYPLVNVANPGIAFTLNGTRPDDRMTSAGLASDFPGASSREIVMGTDTYLNSSQPFTIAMQFIFDGYGVEANPGLFSLKTDSTAFGAFFFTSAAYQDLTFGSSATWLPQKTGANTIAVGEVISLVICFDGVNSLAGSSYSCWINGNEISLANAGAVSAPTAANHFGEFNAGLDFDGAGLGFRLWPNLKLSNAAAAEVSFNYWAPYGIPLETRGGKQKSFFAPVTGLVTQTVTAVATGIAARQVMVLKEVAATASGVAGVVANIVGALTEVSVAAIASGVAAVQKTVFKTVSATASGLAGAASEVFTAITQVAVAAVASGVVTVQKTVFKTVQATASGIAGAVGSTGAVILQSVVAVAQGIAKRNVLVFKTVKDTAPPPVVVDFEASFASAGPTLDMTMPQTRPDDSFYIFAVALNDGSGSTLTSPAELTEIDSRSHPTSKIWIGYRQGDSEPTFYTFTSTANSFTGIFPTWHGLVIRVDGIDPDNVVDQIRNNAATNAITQAVTPAEKNTLLLIFNEGPSGSYTGTDPTTIYFGQTDDLISLAAVQKLGTKDDSVGSVNFTHSEDGSIVFIGQMTSFPPVQGEVGPTAKGIVEVLSQIFIKVNPFTGHGGLGMVDRITTRWRRRRSTWRRRR